MKAIRWIVTCTVMTLVVVAPGCRTTANLLPGAPTPETIDVQRLSATSSETESIEEAIRQAIAEEKAAAPALLLYDTQIENILLSQDGNWATAWITPVDPDTGQVVPTEPGMAIVRRTDGAWKAYLPTNPEWALVIQETPDDLVAPEQKAAYGVMAEMRVMAAPAAPLAGYRLPYAGGDTMSMTQSVGHDRYTPSGSAHYAFDFAKPGYPSGMFNVHAAKGGVVTRVRWTQENGSTAEPGNYVVLEDRGTSPVTYQLYLHLAKDSVPQALRTVGAVVQRGQLLGVADDTGVSSGNHLHFMVHTNPSSYWGTSVDIVFEDVAINGGRPRITSDKAYCRSSDVCDSFQTTYLSQNFLNPDYTPPIGNITKPVTGDTALAAAQRLEAWALDEGSGLAVVRFQGNWRGAWEPIGPSFSSNTVAVDWDLCDSQVPDGPVSLALEIRDKAMNQAPGLPGLTHFTKSYACPAPAPACAPASNQIALFGETDFQGQCVILGAGSYTTPAALGALGENAAVSIQVGAQAQATLYLDSSLSGRGETFTASDANLADNRVGSKTVSSLLVQKRGATPAIPALTWPDNGAAFPSDASLSLSWDNGGGDLEYQARLLRDGAQVQITNWQTGAFWHLSNLAAGSYTWQVKARNGSVEGNWSSSRSLVIQAAAQAPGSPVTLPFNDDMEAGSNGWRSSTGWSLGASANHTPNGASSWRYAFSALDYETGQPNAGYLTSPPIQLPTGGNYFLRFWYQYQTESDGRHWDQRRVQISANGGPFTDLAQLSDDPPLYWVQSPAISLAAYAGQTVQIRFYLATLDRNFNAYSGWFIDDFSISDEPPPACSDADNSPAEATLISYGSTTSAALCPNGDVDYYRFQGNAGDQVGAWTRAQVDGSPLDTYLFMLDSDGRSVLAENDDQVRYQRSDSWTAYRLPRDGTYYLKVRAWNHPGAGGEDYTYTLLLTAESGNPTGQFVYPVTGQGLSSGPIRLQVSASDAQSGVGHVVFQWHAADWLTGGWITLGEDWDGSDGWNYDADTSHFPNFFGGAFYAQIYDWAGNWIGTGAFNLRPPSIYLPLIKKSAK